MKLIELSEKFENLDEYIEQLHLPLLQKVKLRDEIIKTFVALDMEKSTFSSNSIDIIANKLSELVNILNYEQIRVRNE